MIELKDVSFQYEGSKENFAVRDINLTIKKGECILLTGVSGCGKSTITRLINGLAPSFYEGKLTGDVFINNIRINDIPLYEISKLVGSVFQNPRSQFFNVETTGELAFGCENQGMDPRKIRIRIKESVSNFQIDKLLNRSLFELSGGEKQKIACASVYAVKPEIFVLDEPTSNLDFKAIEDLKNTLMTLKKQGKTIIIAEHRLYFLKDIADRVVFIEKGKISNHWTMNEFQDISEEKLNIKGLRTLDNKNLLKMQLEGGISEDKDNGHIRISNFSYSYKRGHKALDIEDFSLPLKEKIAVIGHNGAGKSTFISCLCGLQKHTKGYIYMWKEKLSRKKRLEKSYVVMQDVNHQLFTESVEKELFLGMRKEKIDKANKVNEVNEVMKILDIEDFNHCHPRELSGGQKQRVAIGASITSEKEIVALDEPTSGLDYRQMMNVSKVIEMLNSKVKSVIIVTHDLEFILNCCSYIIHMDKGKIKDSYYLDIEGRKKLYKFFEINE